VGSQAANQLSTAQNYRTILNETSINKLTDFLRELSDRAFPERTYALLGQSFLSHVSYYQLRDVAIALWRNFDRTINVVDIMARYEQKLEPFVDAYEGFHDL